MHPSVYYKEITFSTMDGWASYDCTEDSILAFPSGAMIKSFVV